MEIALQGQFLVQKGYFREQREQFLVQKFHLREPSLIFNTTLVLHYLI